MEDKNMTYKRFNNNYVIHVQKNEDVITELKKLCKAEEIKLASVNGIGAAKYIEIGLFNTNTKEYKTKVLEGMYEITSLMGNVTTKDKEVYLHLHINVSDENVNAFGGHLVKCIVSATSEIVISKIEGEVEREFNEEIGLNLLKM
jgi:predicted DNA-binding protein with PD1-like motif